jgi:excisionase family DNA binding protein
MTKDYYSTSEAAQILRISRITVFNRIQRGKIRAEKIGRNYIISHKAILEALGQTIGQEKKQSIEHAVDKALSEYKKAFKMLGRE